MKTTLIAPPSPRSARRLWLGFFAGVVFLVPHGTPAAGPAPVDLGTATRFTILAGAAITTTGGGPIVGDVGASPIAGSAIGVTDVQVDGTIYAVDASGPAGSVIDPILLTAAKGDLTAAYNDARDRTPVPVGTFLNPGSGNIGGLNLVPGLYKFTGTALITGSDVTLTGGPYDVWIFQVATDLQVGSGIKVILAGGARAKNIFWQVGSSATIGTFAEFKGTLLADQAITMGTSSSIDGRALAFEAGVTFNGVGLTRPLGNQVPLVFHDFDGDGTSDLTVYDQSRGVWFVQSLQHTNEAMIWNQRFGGADLLATSGDYDGDGTADQVVYDPARGLWYVRSAQGATLLWAEPFGYAHTCAVPGDYNGDGVYDLAVYDAAAGKWYIATLDGTVILWGQSWGMASAVPVPGDYDGDGVDDLAVYDTKTGDWHIRTVSGTVLAWYQRFGWSGADPVAGDYDGDGAADEAVYDRERGRWFIQTLPGTVLAWNVQQGGHGRIPVPGDYNGDGADDLAVYAADTGKWYLRSLLGPFVVWGKEWGYHGARPPLKATRAN